MTANVRNVLIDLMDTFFTLYNEDNLIGANKAKLQYEHLSAEAVIANPNAHCNDVDPWQYQEFSDWYKEVNGFRPRGPEWTHASVKQWMDSDK